MFNQLNIILLFILLIKKIFIIIKKLLSIYLIFNLKLYNLLNHNN